jgi:hypothetical protein
VDLKKNNLAALQELRDVFSRHKENLPLPGEAYNPFSQEASCFSFFSGSRHDFVFFDFTDRVSSVILTVPGLKTPGTDAGSLMLLTDIIWATEWRRLGQGFEIVKSRPFRPRSSRIKFLCSHPCRAPPTPYAFPSL